MRSFFISFYSEYYKTRKTLAFWAALILPVIICGLVGLGFYANAAKIIKLNYPAMLLWFRYLGASLGVMGVLILPIYTMFMAFSIHTIEHKNDTWKTLFSQPIDKLAIYTAKFIYAILLILICLLLFALLTLGIGYLLSFIEPKFAFNHYNPTELLSRMYLKLFLASLSILAIQFIFSIIWDDFLKPMGIGFIGIIVGSILSNVKWQYAYLFPYSYPSTVLSINPKTEINHLSIFTPEIYASLAYTVALFFIGYFILLKRNIK